MHVYETPEESRQAGVTYHLIPADRWESSRDKDSYTPEPFEEDGFIHCTNGTLKLVNVANMFYTQDPRRFLVLVLDVSKIVAPVKYEDPDDFFPHIYGPLNLDSVLGELKVARDPDGTFTRIYAE